MSADEFYYDVALTRLTEQSQRVDALDAKTVAAFSFASGILPVSAGLLTIEDGPICAWSGYLLVVGAIVYAVFVVLAFRAYQVATYSLRPDPATLKGYSTTLTAVALRRWVADEYLRSVETNDPRLRRKARYLYWAIVCIPVEVGVLTAALIVSLL